MNGTGGRLTVGCVDRPKGRPVVKPVGGRVAAVTIGAVVCATLAATALGAPPSAITVSNPVGKADLNRTVNLDADGIVFKTKTPTHLLVQPIAFAPLGRTGWHHHPGIVRVVGQSGSVTVYDSLCHAKAYGPGSPNGSVFV